MKTSSILVLFLAIFSQNSYAGVETPHYTYAERSELCKHLRNELKYAYYDKHIIVVSQKIIDADDLKLKMHVRELKIVIDLNIDALQKRINSKELNCDEILR